jgi:putative acetyltransferase
MNDDLPALPATPPGRYRHYKGGEYEVLGAARHSETLEPLVVYRPLYNATGWWVRPHAMFFGNVDIDGHTVPRFARIGSAGSSGAMGVPGTADPSDPAPLDIREDDLSAPATRALLRLHLAGMHADSPPGTSYALDDTGLRDPAVTVWSAWAGGSIAGMAALKTLGPDWGELKSMRTHPDFLRRGVGARLLEHVIGVARGRGMRRLSLETGTGAAFEPALALYRRRGFVDGYIFGGYAPSPHNRFMHLGL